MPSRRRGLAPTNGILDDFPQLKTEDIAEALQWPAAAVDERTLPLTPSA